MKKFLYLFAAAALVLTGCGKDPQEQDPPKPEPEPVAVASVSVEPSSTYIRLGELTRLSATVLPADATNKKVTWSSDAEGVATVSATGLVSGVSLGKATITATTEDGAKTASVVVTVLEPVPALVEDGQVVTYLKSTKPREVPLIFIGEGFTEEDMGSAGLYQRTMTRFTDDLFSVEPFKSYWEYFSVYFVAAVSNEEGDSALGYELNDGWIDIDLDAVNRYVSKVPVSGEIGAVNILANLPKHAASYPLYAGWSGPWNGGAYSVTNAFSDAYVGYPPGNEKTWQSHVFIHELGHAFGYLADEYTSVDYGPTEEDYISLAQSHDMGHDLNVSATDDLAKVPWAHFIGHPNYPYVGAYEGGLTFPVGMWRPEDKGIMRTNGWIANEEGIIDIYFNAPSRELIVKRIMKIAGEEYSFDNFVAKDKYEPDYVLPW